MTLSQRRGESSEMKMYRKGGWFSENRSPPILQPDRRGWKQLKVYPLYLLSPPPLILPRTHSFSISSCCQSFSYSSLVLPCLNVPSSSIESIETLEQYFSRSLWVFHSKANLYQCRYTCRHFPVATRQSHQYLVFQFPKENCVESSELIPQCE